MKTKTYILTLSRTFPKGHPREGEETGFADKVRRGLHYEGHPDYDSPLPSKIHTIRANYGLWKHRIDEVNAGRAVLSVRQWLGAPRRSKQRELFRLDRDSGIGVEKLEWGRDGAAALAVHNEGIGIGFADWCVPVKADGGDTLHQIQILQMMTDGALRHKEEEAIEFIRKGARLAEGMGNGVTVAFSGGKDSVVVLDLVRRSGIEHTAEMMVTGCDTPELMKFVRKEYPDISYVLPKMTMRQVILRHTGLPTRMARFCCVELKESRKRQGVTILGIRAAESVKRAKRSAIEKKGKAGASCTPYTFGDDDTDGGGSLFDNVTQKTAESCLGLTAGDEILLSPIFDWSEADVWNYIRGHSLPYCGLYDNGMRRIGCILCPMKGTRERRADAQRYPLFAERVYLRAIRELMEIGKYAEFDSAEDVFDWWISGKTEAEYFADKRQMDIF